jgi:hypothetical protein
MRRVKPEQFPTMFQNHGVLPQQGGFISMERGQCYACALGIEAIDCTDQKTAMSVFPYPGDQQPWDDGQDIFADLSGLAGLSKAYSLGLSDGWENVGDDGRLDDDYAQGWADGRAAYLNCFRAGLL